MEHEFFFLCKQLHRFCNRQDLCAHHNESSEIFETKSVEKTFGDLQCYILGKHKLCLVDSLVLLFPER